MHKMSTGDDSTLGNYRRISVSIFGKVSGAVAFLDEQIKKSTNGESEEVIADERQMINLLMVKNDESRNREKA